MFDYEKNLEDICSKINIYNYGKHKRDFSYIDLIVNGIYEVYLKAQKSIKLFNSNKSYVPFEIYNLATGKPQTLMKFIKTIENITKKKQLAVYRHNGFWQCVDTKRDLILLNKILSLVTTIPPSPVVICLVG